ncbi:MAG: hypothetical protein GXP62_21190 [Oligoflexia bacterium]|nr:hypothetical protein [Oligoflexia bacterium]
MSEENYPWYVIVQGSELAQGDVIPDCPVVELHVPDDLEAAVRGEAGLPADIQRHRMIVMTQACDLVQAKVDSVVVCPVWSLDEMAEVVPQFKHKKPREKLRRGQFPAYHMLNGCLAVEMDVSIVDFHRIYTLPKAFLGEVARQRGERARLLPPYREHLSQAFARYFMRVGLPVDIPSFL